MSELQQTPLAQLHRELGAKMVPFAGYHMPVQYPQGIIKEHLHTRHSAGLFDVSHMGQIHIKGAKSAAKLECLLPVELEGLAINRQIYALLTNAEGGILDDLMITRWAEDEFFLVVNAACKQDDLGYLRAHLSEDLQITPLFERGLIALQGPMAKDVIAEVAPEAAQLVFMSGCKAQIEGLDCYLTRSGYTGEDGFEISFAAAAAEQVARRLLTDARVAPIGLGARDSLRLEAGLCLYGHDMNADTTAVEAGLEWSISKSRRMDGAKAGGFPGAQKILQQMTSGVERKRVGMVVADRAPVREGAELRDAQGRQVGVVTSGGFSPSLNQPIAMGYLDSEHTPYGTKLLAQVRGKAREVEVAKLPFVKQNYFRGQ